MRGYVQLPPQMRTAVSLPAVSLMCRLPFENKASQAVADAKGTVAASASDIDFGTLKLMC
jgi:hypothetical protein